MDDTDEYEIDPAMAAAMGFSSFGAQPGQKRKFTANDTFVDPAIQKNKNVKATSANATALGIRSLGETKSGETALLNDQSVGSATKAKILPDDLEAYRRGVTAANGDIIYFLPSFIEDPWKDLNPR